MKTKPLALRRPNECIVENCYRERAHLNHCARCYLELASSIIREANTLAALRRMN